MRITVKYLPMSAKYAVIMSDTAKMVVTMLLSDNELCDLQTQIGMAMVERLQGHETSL